MTTDFYSFNVPDALSSVVQQWYSRGESFYIGPENIFRCNGRTVDVKNCWSVNRTAGSWCAYTKGMQGRTDFSLSVRQSQEVAAALLSDWKAEYWSLSLEIACNYACSMCLFHGRENQGSYWKRHPSLARRIPLEEAKQWVDLLAAYGAQALNFTSYGEILLYPHLFELVRYAAGKGLSLFVTTNGALVTPEISRRLKESGFTGLGVSLDALTQPVYAKVRSPRKEDYDAAVRAPLLLLEQGLDVEVSFVEQPANEQEKQAFVDYWKKQGVSRIKIYSKLNYADGLIDGVHKYYEINESMPKTPVFCSAFGNFTVLADGTITGCCIAQIENDAPRGANITFPNIMHGVEEAAEQWKRWSEPHSSFASYCARCGSFALSPGDPSTCDGWEYRKNATGEFYAGNISINMPQPVRRSIFHRLCTALGIDH